MQSIHWSQLSCRIKMTFFHIIFIYWAILLLFRLGLVACLSQPLEFVNFGFQEKVVTFLIIFGTTLLLQNYFELIGLACVLSTECSSRVVLLYSLSCNLVNIVSWAGWWGNKLMVKQRCHHQCDCPTSIHASPVTRSWILSSLVNKESL